MKRLVATVLTLVMVFSMFSALGWEVSYATTPVSVHFEYFGRMADGTLRQLGKDDMVFSNVEYKEVTGSKIPSGHKSVTLMFKFPEGHMLQFAEEDKEVIWEYDGTKGLDLNNDQTFFRIQNYVTQDTKDYALFDINFPMSNAHYEFELKSDLLPDNYNFTFAHISLILPVKEVGKKGDDPKKPEHGDSGSQNGSQTDNQNQGSEQNGNGSQKQDDNSSSDNSSSDNSSSDNSSSNNASENNNANESNANSGDSNTSSAAESQEEESVGSAVDSGVDYFPPVSTTAPATTETVEIEEEEAALGNAEQTTQATTEATTEAVEQTSEASVTETETETVEIEEEEVALGSGSEEGNDSGLKGTGESLPYTGNLPNEVFYIVGALLLVGGILIKTLRSR